jgi:hypothetical protein
VGEGKNDEFCRFEKKKKKKGEMENKGITKE